MLILSIGEALQTGVTGLLLLLDSVIYNFLSILFNLFESLAEAEILNKSAYQSVAERVYVVIGVVALFFITYSLLRALVNPEEINKATSKIATNVVVSVVLIGLIPTFFEKAFEVQNAIISDNIIGNIIFGEGSTPTISSTGRLMAMTSLTAFLQINDSTTPAGSLSWGATKNAIINGANFSLIAEFAEIVNEGIDGASYSPFTSAFCGIFLAYIVLSFCLDLGLRLIKLAFYEIIAPIPILLRILPEKKTVFDNWLKKTLATFFEVFVRIGIIYLIVFIVSMLVGDNISIISNPDLNLIAKVIVFMGIFAFAKQAPKLISEITGIDAGNIKFGIGGKLKDSFSVMGSIPIVGGLGQRAIGAVTGGIGAASTSLMNGAGLSGFGYGALNGWKGKGLQFGKQRQGLYNKVYEYEGKQGLFGGKPMIDKLTSNAKSYASKKYQKHVDNVVENDREFQNVYNQKEKKIRDTRQKEVDQITKQISDLNEQMAQAKDQFLKNQEKEQKTLEALLENERLQFEQEKIDRLKNLREEARRVSNDRSLNKFDKETRLNNINKKIAEVQSTSYSNTELENRIANISNSHFDDSSYKDDLTRLNNELNEKISAVNAPLSADEIKSLKDSTRATLLKNKDLDKKYKAMVSYSDDVAKRKAAKEYRESAEGMNQAAIMEEVFKKLNKDNKGPSSSPKEDKKS